MNDQMNILLEVLEEIKQQNRELKTSVSNLASQPIPTTTTSEENGISLTDVARLIETFARRLVCILLVN